jgi:hypothetical protein
MEQPESLEDLPFVFSMTAIIVNNSINKCYDDKKQPNKKPKTQQLKRRKKALTLKEK